MQDLFGHGTEEHNLVCVIAHLLRHDKGEKAREVISSFYIEQAKKNEKIDPVIAQYVKEIFGEDFESSCQGKYKNKQVDIINAVTSCVSAEDFRATVAALAVLKDKTSEEHKLVSEIVDSLQQKEKGKAKELIEKYYGSRGACGFDTHPEIDFLTKELFGNDFLTACHEARSPNIAYQCVSKVAGGMMSLFMEHHEKNQKKIELRAPFSRSRKPSN